MSILLKSIFIRAYVCTYICIYADGRKQVWKCNFAFWVYIDRYIHIYIFTCLALFQTKQPLIPSTLYSSPALLLLFSFHASLQPPFPSRLTQSLLLLPRPHIPPSPNLTRLLKGLYVFFFSFKNSIFYTIMSSARMKV